MARHNSTQYNTGQEGNGFLNQHIKTWLQFLWFATSMLSGANTKYELLGGYAKSADHETFDGVGKVQIPPPFGIIGAICNSNSAHGSGNIERRSFQLLIFGAHFLD